MKVVLVRHTSVDVTPGVCYGVTDVPLKSTFAAEADVVKRNLAVYDFDVSYTSPLSRCVRLADYCGYADAVRDSRLREMDFGEWEMRRFDDITDERLQLWYDDYFHVRATGGESFCDQRRRFESFIGDLHASGARRPVVFAHGGILMQALLLSGVATESNIFSFQPPYGGIIEVEL